jgi:hypothetical protein
MMTIATRLEHPSFGSRSASVHVFPDTLAMQGLAKHERAQSFVSLERLGNRRMRVSSVQYSSAGSQAVSGYCSKGVYVGPGYLLA